MDLITFLAHVPTYPFTICEHLMATLTTMCNLKMGCFEEWGDWMTCEECGISIGYSITNDKKGNISIDNITFQTQTYYLHIGPTATMPPIYRLKPHPKLRCMEEP